MTRLLYQHPTTVTGVAVDVDGRIATSCFDGVQRIFSPTGALLEAVDVSPGTINQARQCVAFRLGRIVTGDYNEYAIALRDNGTVCRPDDVPVISPPPNLVRDISLRGRFAVADDRRCYNLDTGANWKYAALTGALNDPGFSPGGCQEFGNSVWTAGPDGYLRRWSDDGILELPERFVDPQGLNSVDVNAAQIVASGWSLKAYLFALPLDPVAELAEFAIIHQIRCTPDGMMVYGTADGRLMFWDGMTETVQPPAPAPVSKPGKHHK